MTAGEALADRLAEAGYQALFGRAPNRALVDSLTGAPGVGPALLQIADDARATCEVRFLAAELLFREVDMVLHAELDPSGLARCYFEVLSRAYTGNAGDWGFEKGPNALGVLGRTAVANGYGRAFETGLDDDQPLAVSFSGSIPDHFAPPYRVKDVAALIVVQARGLPLDLTGTSEDRDHAIAELVRILKSADG